MQQPIAMNGGFYYSPDRAARISGMPAGTLVEWLKTGVTSYGYSLDITDHRGHRLIEERDACVVGAVQKDFPLGRGPIPSDRQAQMRSYAARVRAKLAPRA